MIRSCAGSLILAVAFGLGASLSGCGGGEGSVSTVAAGGTVSYNGNPVANAQIQFSPLIGSSDPSTSTPLPNAIATTDSAGKFQLQLTSGKKGAAPGKYKVTVSLFESTGIDAESASTSASGSPEDMMAKMTKGMQPKVTEGKPDEPSRTDTSLIPVKYSKESTSPLELTVENDESKNNFTITLAD